MADKQLWQVTPVATDVKNDDGVIIGGQTAGTRYALLTLIANYVHNLWAEFINAITPLKTSFANGDKFPVVNGSTATAMEADTLLKLTAQNALAGNVAPEFIPSSEPNPTTTIAGKLYIYNGSLYEAKESGYTGPWDASKFISSKVSDILSSLEGRASATVENLFDSSAIGYLSNSLISGSTYVTVAGYYVSQPLRVKAGVKYKATFPSSIGANLRYAILDDGFNLVSTELADYDCNDTDHIVFSVEEDCYIRLNLGYGLSWSAVSEYFIVAEYSEFPANYVSYGREIKPDVRLGETMRTEVAKISANNEAEEFVPNSTTTLAGKSYTYNGLLYVAKEAYQGSWDASKFESCKVSDLLFSLENRESATIENLFNPSTSGYLTDTIISGSTYVTITGYYVSQPLRVKAGIKYKATFPSSSMGTNLRFAILDDEYNLVATALADYDGNDTDHIVFSVSEDCFIRLNMGLGLSWSAVSEDFIVAEYSEFPTEYVPFGREIKPDVRLGDKMREEVADISSSGLFKGKILAVNGDSICQGLNAGGGYGQIIADRFGMVFENRGVGGGTIAAGTTTGGGADRHWICRDIANMRADADYVLVEGGVNDASLGVTMGSISTGYNRTLDDTTFAGAMESVVRDVLIKYAGKKVGFIAVHKMTNGYRSDGPDTNYFWTAKKICDKWGMPFLDLNTSCPAFGLYENNSPISNALKVPYTLNGDGWHPTEDGYKVYYVDKIIEFMRSL